MAKSADTAEAAAAQAKVVQIVSATMNSGYQLYALCDDGSIWARTIANMTDKWVEVPLPPNIVLP